MPYVIAFIAAVITNNKDFNHNYKCKPINWWRSWHILKYMYQTVPFLEDRFIQRHYFDWTSLYHDSDFSEFECFWEYSVCTRRHVIKFSTSTRITCRFIHPCCHTISFMWYNCIKYLISWLQDFATSDGKTSWFISKRASDGFSEQRNSKRVPIYTVPVMSLC